MLRISLQAEDPLVAEQVRRVAEAAGAVVVGPAAPADVLLVEARPGRAPRGPAPPEAADGPRPSFTVMLDSRRSVAADLRPGSTVGLPGDAEALLRFLSLLGAPARARFVPVLGTRGGIGASTLAASLARAAARAGSCTALAELHYASGGLDLLLAAEQEPGPRWADLRAERGGFPAEALAVALPRWESVRLLSGDARGGPAPDDPGALDAVRALAATHDTVVLDLPRDAWLDETRDLAESAGARPGAFLLVAACDVRSVLGAGALGRRLAGLDVRLVVRRRPHDSVHPVEVAEACGLPLAAELGNERGAGPASERGEVPGDRPRGPVSRTAAALVKSLGLVP